VTGSALGGEIRVGFGRDSHPFGPGFPLRLCGVDIAGAPRLYGHSDGDAALHAVADALLGAVAMGDLGGRFPADRRTPAGIDSRTMLASVVDHLAGSAWQPAALDLTIVGARPPLARHLAAMRAQLAELLHLDAERVSIKASSGNRSGDPGAGRTIAAEALATVSRSRATGAP
jgi:2-C-methyl-D-erythritol 2,4-cyclodiphosphate synthase